MKLITLGQTIDGVTKGADITLSPFTLLKHVVLLGASGSGKTCLAKVIVEDAVRLDIPIIAIDSQGDIASLKLHGEVNSLISDEYWDKVDIKIWTPGSELGTPISLQPNLDLGAYTLREDRIRAVHSMAQELAYLAGTDDEAAVAGFSKIIDYADRHSLAIDDIEDVCDFLRDPPLRLSEELDPLLNKKERAKLLKSIIIKQSGPRQLLMEMGDPINIDDLLGYSDTYANGKTRISVISLAAMPSLEDRQIFVAALSRALYAWMVADPKPYPTALLYLDEAAPYIPPVKKPPCKDPLMLLLRQGRKYGVGVLIATQSPGDIDYIAAGQAGTKLLGRLVSQQESWKVRPMLDNDGVDTSLIDGLPSLQQGQFIVVCPDEFKTPKLFQSRQLITKHITMTIEEAVL